MAGEFGQAMLQLRFFGPFALRIGPVAVPAPRIKKIVPLLALLSLRAGRDVDRSFLAGTLWSESTDDGAALNLRRLLSDLREYLGTEAERLETPSRGRVRFSLSDSATADILAFDSAVRRWERTGDLGAAEEAVAYHGTGRFLEGFDDDWILTERTARETVCLQLLDALAADALTRADAPRAERFARQSLSLDPLREPSQLLLYRALASGDAPAAIRAYEAFRSRLLQQANQKPGSEITAFVEQLRTSSSTKSAPPASVPPHRPTTPTYLTPIIGRTGEQAMIRKYLQASDVRLLTLLGTGGVGKTRLAVTIARDEAVRATFGERVHFASLAPLPAAASPAAIWQVLADTLPGARRADETAESVVRRTLRAAPALLILDNAEHLSESTAIVAEVLLQDAAALRVLVTSRTPVNVPGEQIVPVLPLPPADAVQLLQERARASRPQLSSQESSALFAELCAKLDYLPLALELVAVRLRTMPIHRAVELLHDRFRLLATESAVLPARQRRIEETVAWSVNLLSPRERTAFACLSVFAGGFTGEMASAVANADDFVVANLADASLLTLDSDGRYRMLDTIRAYAANRLNEMPEARSATWQRFAQWGSQLTTAAHNGFWGSKAAYWTDRLQTEQQNLVAALVVADAHTGINLLQGLYQFWWRRAEWGEGLAVIETALAKPDLASADPERLLEARAYREHFRRHSGLAHCLEARLREYVAFSLANGHSVTAIYLCYSLSGVLAEQGALEDAWEQMQLGLRLARDQSDETMLAYALRGACRIAQQRRDLDTAYMLGAESLRIYRTRPIPSQLAHSLLYLGNVCADMARHAEAHSLLTEARDIARSQRADDVEAEALCLLVSTSRALGETKRAERYFAEVSLLLTTHHNPALAARLGSLRV